MAHQRFNGGKMVLPWLEILYISFNVVLFLFWIKTIQTKNKLDSGEIKLKNIED